MQYEQPIPFYMAYPFLLPLDQEQAQEKDLQADAGTVSEGRAADSESGRPGV